MRDVMNVGLEASSHTVAETGNATKKPYHSPKLEVSGEFRDLTLAGSGGGGEVPYYA